MGTARCFISDLIWGPQYTGLSAYLPEPFAALTSITICYDIGSIILIGILQTLIILTKNGKLGATVKRLVPNVSMGRVRFPNSRIFSWKAKKSTSAIVETAINPENSQTERKKKRKRKRKKKKKKKKKK